MRALMNVKNAKHAFLITYRDAASCLCGRASGSSVPFQSLQYTCAHQNTTVDSCQTTGTGRCVGFASCCDDSLQFVLPVFRCRWVAAFVRSRFGSPCASWERRLSGPESVAIVNSQSRLQSTCEPTLALSFQYPGRLRSSAFVYGTETRRTTPLLHVLARSLSSAL